MAGKKKAGDLAIDPANQGDSRHEPAGTIPAIHSNHCIDRLGRISSFRIVLEGFVAAASFCSAKYTPCCGAAQLFFHCSLVISA
jgi:hypothetical protein